MNSFLSNKDKMHMFFEFQKLFIILFFCCDKDDCSSIFYMCDMCDAGECETHRIASNISHSHECFRKFCNTKINICTSSFISAVKNMRESVFSSLGGCAFLYNKIYTIWSIQIVINGIALGFFPSNELNAFHFHSFWLDVQFHSSRNFTPNKKIV